ncbi:serine/threonine-protein kinase [Streptomyces sp. NPDC000410]|uniref:serine/threonine-protein kinase n=1 Tax=Streptomyces sp. NPDC000410 TaxID=3154254 RepID=UPI00332E6B64
MRNGPDQRLLGGRYVLEDLLGRGGMGRVWRAHDQVLDREVAVKEVSVGGLPEDELQVLESRMEQEARAAARVKHPSVVTVHDVLRQEGRPWIVMELIDGRSLADLIASEGPLPPREAARIGVQLLSALERAHQAGVIHRDVKPANVLLEPGERSEMGVPPAGGWGRVVLTDFGIAALEGSARYTRAGVIVGSPDYLAPEQISDGRAGPAADLWSLGATLYTAVEGRSPFGRPTAASTLHAVVSDPLPEPVRAGALRPALEALLRKDPEARPTAEGARRLLEAVGAAGADHPATQVALAGEERGSLPTQTTPAAPAAQRVPPAPPAPPAPPGPPHPPHPPHPPAPLAATTPEGERRRPSAAMVTTAVVVLLLAAAGLLYATLRLAGPLPAGLAWIALIAAAAGLLYALHTYGQDRAAVALVGLLLAAGGAVYAWFKGAGPLPIALAGALGLLAAGCMGFLLHKGGLPRAAVAAVLIPLLVTAGMAYVMFGHVPGESTTPTRPPPVAVPDEPAKPTPPPAKPEPEPPPKAQPPPPQEQPPAPEPQTQPPPPKEQPPAPQPRPQPPPPPPTTQPPPEAPAPAGYRWVDDPAGFRVAVPEGWTRSVKGEQVDYSPDGGVHLLRFAVHPGGGVVPSEHLLELEENIQLPGYERVALVANTYQGRPGALWEFTWSDGEPRHGIDQAFIAPNGKEYLIYLGVPESDWPAGKQVFDSVLSTFSPS